MKSISAVIVLVLVAGGAILYVENAAKNTADPASPARPIPPVAAIAGPPGKPHFGMNLASVVDWSREWAFVDVFKHSRPWIEHGPKPFGYDAHGWPMICPGQRVETLMVREVEGHYPAGRYVATWHGVGAVDVPGFDVSGP